MKLLSTSKSRLTIEETANSIKQVYMDAIRERTRFPWLRRLAQELLFLEGLGNSPVWRRLAEELHRRQLSPRDYVAWCVERFGLRDCPPPERLLSKKYLDEFQEMREEQQSESPRWRRKTLAMFKATRRSRKRSTAATEPKKEPGGTKYRGPK